DHDHAHARPRARSSATGPPGSPDGRTGQSGRSRAGGRPIGGRLPRSLPAPQHLLGARRHLGGGLGPGLCRLHRPAVPGLGAGGDAGGRRRGRAGPGRALAAAAAQLDLARGPVDHGRLLRCRWCPEPAGRHHPPGPVPLRSAGSRPRSHHGSSRPRTGQGRERRVGSRPCGAGTL
ncbi:MAG: hypothetical protein AVDCRST_MAG76-441, partial [uncultured Acidimicrobiales bacterium]